MQLEWIQLFRNTSSFSFSFSFYFFHHLQTNFSLKVNKAQSLSFTLKNQRSEIAEVSLHFFNTLDPHSCLFDPSSCFFPFYFIYQHQLPTVSLQNNIEKKVTLSLTMSCTARLSTSVIVVLKGIGCCFVPLHAESSPSSFLSLEEVQLGKTLGKGTYAMRNIFPKIKFMSLKQNRFGQVYLGKYRGEAIAVKQIVFIHCESFMKMIENEIKLMETLRSPYVVSFYGAMVCLFIYF